MEIYTIGHSNYSVERLIDMLKKHHINCVVDIRGTPYSKYNIQYNKETIRNTLINEGFTYIYMAKELAAKRENKQSYNKEGYSDFEKVCKEDDFLSGIALLGAMQEPIRCHRSVLVGRALREEDFDVKHILHDYSIASQEDIEEMLLDKYFSKRYDLTIDELLGNKMSREDMIKEGYRRANKEIGYRIEHIDEKK